VAALVDELGLTREAVGRRVGRSRVAISNLLRLLDLPDDALALVESGALSEGHGRALLLAADHDDRRRLARAAADGGWSVRVLEEKARQAAGAAAPLASAAPPSTRTRKPRRARSAAARRGRPLGDRWTRLCSRPGGTTRTSVPKAAPECAPISLAAASWSEWTARGRRERGGRAGRPGAPSPPGHGPTSLRPPRAREAAPVVVVGRQQRARPWPRTAPRLDERQRVVGQIEQAQEVGDRHRLRPTRRPTASRVRPSSSTRAATARASSTGLRSSRAMFSMTALSRLAASSRLWTIAGTDSRPAIPAARHRRSPATSSKVPPGTGRTRTG